MQRSTGATGPGFGIFSALYDGPGGMPPSGRNYTIKHIMIMSCIYGSPPVTLVIG